MPDAVMIGGTRVNLPSFLLGSALMLPLGGLCLWLSFRLGRRLRVTDELMSVFLGIAVFPWPFTVAFLVLFHLFRLPHDAEYAFSAILVAGWMGAGIARVQNLNDAGPKN